MEQASPFLEKFIRWYTKNACMGIGAIIPDVVAPVSYCAVKDGLAIATEKNFLAAVEQIKRFPRAALVFGNCAYAFPGAAEIEHRYKTEILQREHIAPERILEFAGLIKNSISEARSAGAVLKKNKIIPKNILVITGEMHAPSARLIWSMVFPDANIFTICTSYRYEAQTDHPLAAQRSYARWLMENVLRHAVIAAFGGFISGWFRHWREKNYD